jgi:TolB-like protein/DNA-binding winged helix-turn-helix (wHTH) protein/Tfp pilus assembly protein PilF
MAIAEVSVLVLVTAQASAVLLPREPFSAIRTLNNINLGAERRNQSSTTASRAPKGCAEICSARKFSRFWEFYGKAGFKRCIRLLDILNLVVKEGLYASPAGRTPTTARIELFRSRATARPAGRRPILPIRSGNDVKLSYREESMASANDSRIIRFGLFEVDLRTGELRKNGVKIRLQQQPFQILVILLQHPGEIVTREELHEQLWPADTFVDFDHSLNAAIKRLRDALGESAENPIYIETLARRGYRFNAPLQSAPLQAAVLPGAPRRFTNRSALFVLTGTGLAIIFLAGAFLWAGRAHRNPGAKKRIESIAVLPLANLSRDPEQEYFSDGMTGALIADLSKIRPLRIISRTSTVRYKGTNKSLPEIARELNVDAIIEGSVLRSGNRVRINVELIEASSDKHLWGENYDRELGDVLKLHSEVAQAIANQIQIQLAPDQQARLHAAPSINQGAYEDYLRARWTAQDWSYQGIKLAKQYFEASIQKDPGFALAYVGLADCYLTLGQQRRIPPQEAYRQSSELIDKALQLDETLGEAHSSLGMLSWRYEWNWTNAEREFQRALELNPNNLDAREGFAWFLSWSGRREEALREIAKMRELDPPFPLLFLDQAGLHYHLREYHELVDSSQEAVELDPGAWSSHYFLGTGYFGLGRKLDAIPEFQKAVDLSQGDSDTLASLAYAYVAVGRRAEAQKILGALQRQSQNSYVSPYMFATIWAGLGDKDRAFEFLEKAYDEKSTDLAYFIKADLRLDGLRSDPRLIDLLRRMALPH